MRIVIQRVKQAHVDSEGQVIGSINAGLVVFLGIAKTDTTEDADYLVDKLLGLRIFSDEAGKMNRSVVEVNGGVLIVSNFTLYGDCRKGRRPSFDLAASSDQANQLYEYFVRRVRTAPVSIQTGIFRASMSVYLVNDGPVTLSCDSAYK